MKHYISQLIYSHHSSKGAGSLALRHFGAITCRRKALDVLMEAIEKSGHAGKAPVRSPWSLEVLLKIKRKKSGFNSFNLILPWKTSRTLMRHDDSTKNDKNGEFRWWKGWCNGQRSRIVGMWISQTLVVSDIACFHISSRSPTTDMFWGWHGMALKHVNQLWFNWASWRWMFSCPCALPVLWSKRTWTSWTLRRWILPRDVEQDTEIL